LPTGDRAANLARAIACYEAALRFYTPEAAPLDYAMTQNNLGEAYRNLPTGDRAANLARAIACYEAALRIPNLSPWEEVKYWSNLADVCREQGQVDAAIEAYQHAIALDPERADDHTMLGSLYELQGRLDDALREHQQAVTLEPGMGMRHGSLASVLRKLGRDEEAAAHLARARELIPPDDHYNLACLEAIAGNTDAALDHLEKALAQNPARRDWAARDPDLESLRDHPRFKRMTNERMGE